MEAPDDVIKASDDVIRWADAVVVVYSVTDASSLATAVATAKEVCVVIVMLLILKTCMYFNIVFYKLKRLLSQFTNIIFYV